MSALLVEYEYIILNMKRHKRKYKLPYLQKFMTRLEDQSSSNIYKLRKKGYKVCMREGEYYLLCKRKKINLASKKKIVSRIFNISFAGYGTLKNYLEIKFLKNTFKKSSGFEDSEHATILSILGTFWMSDGSDLATLTMRKIKRIKRYEIHHYLDAINDSKKTWFEIIKTTPERLAYFEDNHRMQTKRWKKSKTYKLNKLLLKFDNYTSKWAYIDNTNRFQFLQREYALDKNIDNYKVRADCTSNMDLILCIKDNNLDLIKFYDMDISEIPASSILDVTPKTLNLRSK